MTIFFEWQLIERVKLNTKISRTINLFDGNGNYFKVSTLNLKEEVIHPSQTDIRMAKQPQVIWQVLPTQHCMATVLF